MEMWVGPTFVFSPKNSTTLAAVSERNPNKFVCRLAAKFGIRPSSMYRILGKTLHMFSYQIQCWNAISVRAERQREDLSNLMLDKINDSGSDGGLVWLTNKAVFSVHGIVSRHSWRFWDTQNLHFSHSSPLYQGSYKILV